MLPLFLLILVAFSVVVSANAAECCYITAVASAVAAADTSSMCCGGLTGLPAERFMISFRLP